MRRTGAVGLVDSLTRIAKLIGAAFAIALVVVLLANIISREVFAYSMAWANEAAVALFVWMAFIGVGVCFADQSRIRFTMIADVIPSRANGILQMLVTYVGMVLLVGFFLTSIYATWLYRHQVFATMPFSASWQWAAIPTGMALAVIGWIRGGTWLPEKGLASNEQAGDRT